MATYYGDAYANTLGPYSGPNTIYGGAGNDTIEGGSDNDTYIFNFGSDGQDLYYDSQGSYDTLRINGVTNISQLTITSAATYGGSGNNLVIHKDGSLAEYVQIYDFYSGSGFGAGRIEYLDVNGSVFWLSDYLDAV